MNKPRLVFILITSTLLLSVIAGFLLRAINLNEVREMYYLNSSREIAKFSDKTLHQAVIEIKNASKQRGVYLLEEYEVDSSTYEVIWQSGRTWLISGLLHKVTFVGYPSLNYDKPNVPPNVIKVYGGNTYGDSLPLVSITVIIILFILAVFIKKEKLADLYPHVKQVLPSKKIIYIIFSVSLVIRLLFLILMINEHGVDGTMNLFNDSQTYFKVAATLFDATSGNYELYLVGPGYAFILAVFGALFGNNFLPVLIIQIFLSSISSVIIYKLSLLLTGNNKVSTIAGLLSTISMTSISLANSFLTETVFFFLLILSIYLYLKALDNKRWVYFVVSGLLCGLSVLVRSAAMFFPIIFLISTILYLWKDRRQFNKPFIARVLVSIFIMILIPLSWSVRNEIKHDVFTVSGTGIGAAKLYLSGKTIYSSQNRPVAFFKQYRDSLSSTIKDDIENNRIAKIDNDARSMVISTLKSHPGIFLDVYFDSMLDNITSISLLHYTQLPRLEKVFEYFDKKWSRRINAPYVLILTLLGFFVFARINWRRALILLLIVGYFALLSGFTFGQGSRIYFPAQIAWSILVAIALVFLYGLCKDLIVLAKRGKQDRVPL